MSVLEPKNKSTAAKTIIWVDLKTGDALSYGHAQTEKNCQVQWSMQVNSCHNMGAERSHLPISNIVNNRRCSKTPGHQKTFQELLHSHSIIVSRQLNAPRKETLKHKTEHLTNKCKNGVDVQHGSRNRSSHSATLPERLDQPLNHSGRAAPWVTEWLVQPLLPERLSGWVAGPASLAEWLSGWVAEWLV